MYGFYLPVSPPALSKAQMRESIERLQLHCCTPWQESALRTFASTSTVSPGLLDEVDVLLLDPDIEATERISLQALREYVEARRCWWMRLVYWLQGGSSYSIAD